ncbi:zinc-binding dehydrogenase [Undibacterium sp.]|uniref:zinc-binding dehydrogenase n=1 Tax=Undibacterium sp. TaxID=1914977 RepID=UPI00374D7911
MNRATYRAAQVSKPGQLDIVNKEVLDPAAGQVRLRVEACGICHTDAVTVEGGVVDIDYPRVPGHEIVGCIEALGENAGPWKIGQRVGVGFLAGHCNSCAECRRGNFTSCSNQQWTGIHHDGGYAERMIANANALVSIPDSLQSVEAAPLLCAGLTVFKALKKSAAQAENTVAIHGIGGLGHLAVQFARKMGFRTIAIARGQEKEEAAKLLGAHHYIDSEAGDAAAALQALGGAKVLISTVTNPKAVSPLIAGLAPHGRLVMVGVSGEAIEVSPFALIQNDVSIIGSLTGSTIESEDALSFSALQDIRAKIETVPLEDASAAYARMMRNEAKFRIVLTM